ncbi:potassium transporter [Fervidicella metallireducens AeB]|uniref:Potassium transporter n=1 Tax=Fervidicella metallireducens AeB TaxID=1403537 RepID=A0A017RXR5_9CLOT|nr:cation:proton antiporter [Fervidicella metallireducens]EYE88735.1 potassium transporter [Fervidicella metallireducens AeB]
MHEMLLEIAIILIATTIGGTISNRMKMPRVLGALIAGIIIGPSVLGIAKENEEIKLLAELGVVMLMFLAGLETNLEEFKKAGMSSAIIAVGGVIVPLLTGIGTAYLFSGDFWTNLYIGVILTATSVSITVQTLNELGKLNTRAGMNIIGAAVIDDILGLIIISFVLVMFQTSHTSKAVAAGTTMQIAVVIAKVIIFCIGSVLAVAYLPKVINKFTEKRKNSSSWIVLAIAGALLFALISEELGIADITGSYVFGLVHSSVKNKSVIEKKAEAISSYFLTPIFFAHVGLIADFKAVNIGIILFTLVMVATAFFSKIIGCGIGAKIFGFNKRESLQIAVGMVSRGEVALITTTLGMQNGIIPKSLFIPTLMVVVITTIVTPILLKLSFENKSNEIFEIEAA